MMAGWVEKTIAPNYRKPLCYALLLHAVLLIILLFNLHSHHRIGATANSAAKVMNAMMINTVQLPPKQQPKPTPVAPPVKHHKVATPPHKKVVVKKVVHKKTPHHSKSAHVQNKKVKTPTHAKSTHVQHKKVKTVTHHHTTKQSHRAAAVHTHHHSVKKPVQHKSIAHKTTAHKQTKKTKAVAASKPPVKKVVAPTKETAVKRPETKRVEVKKTVSKRSATTTDKKVAATHTAAAATTQHHKTPVISQAQINSYVAQLKQAIRDHWIIPTGANPQLSCRLLITLAGDGSVLDVTVERPSGDPALDRSAVVAVLRATLPSFPSGVDSSQLRTIHLTMRPESVISGN